MFGVKMALGAMGWLKTGGRIIDLDDYHEEGKPNGGHFKWIFCMDQEWRLWVLCADGESVWMQATNNLLETWRFVKGIDWQETAKFLPVHRWQVED